MCAQNHDELRDEWNSNTVRSISDCYNFLQKLQKYFIANILLLSFCKPFRFGAKHFCRNSAGIEFSPRSNKIINEGVSETRTYRFQVELI